MDANNMNFDELILEAAKSIAAATAALIKAASEAQKELVSQGKLQKVSSIHSEDGQWSEGLVSAARLVAAATHNLCEAANALVNTFLINKFLVDKFLINKFLIITFLINTF